MTIRKHLTYYCNKFPFQDSNTIMQPENKTPQQHTQIAQNKPLTHSPAFFIDSTITEYHNYAHPYLQHSQLNQHFTIK